MPEDLAPGFEFRRIIEDFLNDRPSQPGPYTPGDMPRDDLLDAISRFRDNLPGGDTPEIPDPGVRRSLFLDELRELLDREFPDGLPGEGPPTLPRIVTIEEILEDRLGRTPFSADAAPEPKAVETEWEGNVPPDLTDGFDFLL